MADSRRSPLAGFVFPVSDRVRIVELPFVPKFNVRSATDLKLPAAPNTVLRDGSVAALWLGPDEWLVVGGPVDGGLDVSAQYTVISVAGSAVFDVLAHGCALDLGSAGVDWCAQTTVARANVILWGAGEDEVRIFVRSSFARYLAKWLVDAASE